MSVNIVVKTAVSWSDEIVDSMDVCWVKQWL